MGGYNVDYMNEKERLPLDTITKLYGLSNINTEFPTKVQVNSMSLFMLHHNGFTSSRENSNNYFRYSHTNFKSERDGPLCYMIDINNNKTAAFRRYDQKKFRQNEL